MKWLILGIFALIAAMFSTSGGSASHNGIVPPVCADYAPPAPLFAHSRNAGDGDVDIQDLTSFLSPTRHLDTNVGDPGYHPAWDRVNISPPNTDININDMLNIYVPTPGHINYLCEGRVRYIHNMRSDFDYLTNNPPAGGRDMVNSHYFGGIVYPSASGGNSCCEKSWFKGQQYVYLIWERMERLNDHDEHAGGFNLTPATHGLTNMNGTPCMYGGSGDHIVDFGDSEVKSKLIAYYADAFADWAHYDGPYADDFNIGLKEMNCDGNNGNSCSSPYTSLDCPKNPDTGQQMTLDEWTGRAADLAEAIKLAFPTRPFMVNTQPTAIPTSSYNSINHNRILAVVDYVEIEHGVQDITLNWQYADAIHSQGADIVWQGYIPNNVPLTQQNKLFALASYLLVHNGRDFYMTFKDSFPPDATHTWDSVYETDMRGPANGPRFLVSGSLWKRNFAGGGYVTVDVGTGTGVIVP